MLRRWISLWFVLALTLVSANLLAPASVSAEPAIAASCYGATCNGLDPYAAGCLSDAYTVATNEFFHRSYSPSCNAYFGIANIGYSVVPYYLHGWMEAEFNATYSFGVNYVRTGMWESGRACVYNEWDGIYRCV